MNIHEEIDDACRQLSLNKKSVRVSGKAAKEMLMRNTFVSMPLGGARPLRLLHLGMGVYEVNIADIGCANKTILLKK